MAYTKKESESFLRHSHSKGSAHLAVLVLIGSVTAGLLILYFTSVQNILTRRGTDSPSVAKTEIGDCPSYFNKKVCGKKEIDGAEVCKIEKEKSDGSSTSETWYCCPKNDTYIKYSKKCCDKDRIYTSLNFDEKLGWKQDKACCSLDLDEDGNCPGE